MRPHSTNENSYSTCRNALLTVSRIFNGFPDCLKKQSLLRINQLRFHRRYAEEQRIEFIDICDEPSPLAITFSRLASIGVVIHATIPSIRRDLRNTVATVFQVSPEFFQIVRLRIFSAEADNGNIRSTRASGFDKPPFAAKRRRR